MHIETVRPPPHTINTPLTTGSVIESFLACSSSAPSTGSILCPPFFAPGEQISVCPSQPCSPIKCPVGHHALPSLVQIIKSSRNKGGPICRKELVNPPLRLSGIIVSGAEGICWSVCLHISVIIWMLRH